MAVRKLIFLPHGRSLTIGERTLVMGILNCTPDSFFDGGRRISPEEHLEAGLRMLQEGADLLDLGGESTRPGAQEIPAEEENRRILPVLRLLRKQTEAPLSIDTRKKEVAEAALAEGADIINDVSAFRYAPGMARLVAQSGAGVILMHMQGTPATMQHSPHYRDVVTEVRDFLLASAAFAESEGVSRDRILLDPGFGFGKTFAHNAALLERLDHLVASGYPVVVGLSRKSMIGHALGLPVEERLEASLALAVYATLRGAAMVRVHDVQATVRAVRMVDAVQRAVSEGGMM